MEKLSQRFYEQIKSRIEGEIEDYVPEEHQLDIRYGSRVTSGEGTSTLGVEVELPEGYSADVSLRVYTSFCKDNGDYFIIIAGCVDEITDFATNAIIVWNKL